MPRAHCPHCSYPLPSCLCHAIKHYRHKSKLIILQHPSEIKSKKNTVRLLSLISDKIQIANGETESDFDELKRHIAASNETFALLYPSDQAINCSTFSQQRQKNESPVNLLVLDGTWRKVKKILLSNPWLLGLPHLTLVAIQKSQYGIRKTQIEGGLSTLEAVALALQELEGVSPKPALDMLQALKQAFTRKMPNEVKNRYDI